MPFNLLKNYNDLLELGAFNEHQRKKSLQGVFDRDFTDIDSLCFNSKPVKPTPEDGEIKMSNLFSHLTTVIVDKKTRRREYDNDRSIRLHWVKYHIDCRKETDVLHFSVKEPQGIRTYIYDKVEKYVVILEPKRKVDEYYLLTAYYVRGKDAKRDKFLKKYKRKLDKLH